ncbi:TPA: DUF4142 domain-containing protein [Acinetobacter baumannii]|uniref:DUF4142 domain-containing protein n=1 Tax=Acinetobacter baumannii EGD-HP18 TaxID=1358412 RepID=A0AAV3K1A4_ACIBA|nr:MULTISPECIES: DUF4142 domain-containing protein [Acinetobacter]ERH70900.1 hypothetical protein N173_14360 [Acinetobacter baumannii EGD-HP18]MBJ9388535.1 DUF4142 domain-containing protein [Acinetobacter baumannii]MCE6409067.1 DUF4142 domain-containing protein [Acinetobacter baumannii]MCT9371842.1 DUF4142 domain-containing protein [Acinetobacter baumannii]MCZ3123916.1 DUF4142 domain-containing protein [Acinetobacter baumannii]
MKAILTKKIISCIAISGVLSFSAFEIMAANQQTINDGKNHSTILNENYENLTDSQIFKILSTANNGEIKQAKTALPKLKMDEAKKYAEMMIKEHSANEKNAQALASRLQLISQTSNLSKSLQNDSDKIISKLNQITSDTDKNYMMSQVKVHRKVLTIIDKQLIPNTKSSELKNMLVQTRDAVAKHLKAAEDIFKNMK